MSYYVKNGITKEVKNLGWLLAYARKHPIRCITTRQWNDGTQYLEVSFKDGVKYETEFASMSVLNDWLKSRRSWEGTKVHFVLFGKFQSTWEI